MKKKLLAALLCAAMMVSVVACGDNGEENKPNKVDITTLKQPAITTLASVDDLKSVLKGDYAVTDEDIDDYFNKMLCAVDAGLIRVKDRTVVQAGDVVQVDYTGYLNDKAFDNGAAKNQIIDVSGNCLFDEATGEKGGTFIVEDKVEGKESVTFTQGMIGAEIDKPVKHKITFPKLYSNKDLAGKETVFEFNVDKIFIKATPDTVTDEYVKEHLGQDGYETVAALLKHCEEELVVTALMNYAIDESKVDIAEEYLNARLSLYEEFLVEAAGGESTIDEIVYYSYGMELEDVRPYWLQYIKVQVKAEVVLAELVKTKNLTVSDEELKEFVDDILKENSSFTKEEQVYQAIGYGYAVTGKDCIKNEFAVKDYLLETYRASKAVTE